jgi:hypothetical protein
VRAGRNHSLAIKKDGSLWAWGRNDYGQLGDGTNTDRPAPVRIGSATDWLSVSTGADHTLALKKDGSLWAWGRNNGGQLGDGTNTDRSSPIRIGSATDWLVVSAGDSFSLALEKDGSLWAWGWNNFGQLGDGTRANRSNLTRIGSANDWLTVRAGGGQSLAIKKDGSLWAWGRNDYGQLGDGTNTDRPSPARVGSATDWLAVSAGGYHSLVLEKDGSLWAWGGNTGGQLGDGTNTDRFSPVRVEVPLQPDVPQTTKVLGGTALSELQSVSPDKSVLVFSPSSAPSLAPGDVIVAGVSATTPTGLLRKVVSVSSSSSGVTVQTSTASLQEAIPEGAFSATATLTPNSVQAASTAAVTGNDAQPLNASAVTGNLGVTISKGNMAFGVGKVSVSGSASFSQAPTITFSSNWDLNNLQASVALSAQETATLTATATPGASGGLNIDLLDKPIFFAPITIMVGPVPVVLFPSLQFKLKVSAGVSGGSTATASVVQKSTVTAGLAYDNGRLTPTGSFSNTFSSPLADPGASGISGNLRVSVGPVVTLALYDVAGPQVNVDGFLDYSIQPSQTPWWVLSGGLQAGAGLNVPYLKLSVSDPNLIQWSETILQASGSAQTLPAAPSNLQGSSTSNSITLSWSDNSNDETGFIINRAVGSGWIEVGRTGAGVKSFIDTGLQPGTEYCYYVGSYNEAGTSWSAQAISVTTKTAVSPPAKPTWQLPAKNYLAGGNVEILWNDWNNDATNVTGYIIYVSNDYPDAANPTWTEIDRVGPNTRSYVVPYSAFDNDARVKSVRIGAYNSAGETLSDIMILYAQA